MSRPHPFLDADLRNVQRLAQRLIPCETKNVYDFLSEDAEQSDIFDRLQGFYGFLSDAKQKHVYTYRRTLLEGSSARVIVYDRKQQREREMLMFASNNYLDLAMDPTVIAAGEEAQRRYGYGSGSVPLLSGTMDLHRELEARIASYYGREACVVFSTGYAANVGTLGSLLRSTDLAVIDMYSHMSIIDGVRFSGALTKVFKHNDIEHADRVFEKSRSHGIGAIMAADGVFSMDGDLCPLPELLRVKAKHNARLLIDEAHAIGIIGPRGRGTEDYYGENGKVDILTGTLSKSPAGLGGFLVGSCELVEYVRHFANTYVFSTSLPPAVTGGLLRVFDLLEGDVARREQLWDNAAYLTKALQGAGFNTGHTKTAIVPVIVGPELLARKFALDLDEAGIFACPITFPAVSKAQARIRFSVMATHTRKDLDYVVATMQQLAASYGML